MTAKVQPSLTITQLNPIGKLTAAGGASGPTMTPQGVASIQAVPTVSASVTSSSVPAGVSTASAAAGGATVLPLTLGARSGPANSILTGTLTPIKNASGITVGKMMMTQSAGVDAGVSGGLSSSGTPTNVFIQQRGGSGSAVSVSATAAGTSVATSSTGASFLPPGSSAIYYESMTAASTGVLSLTTTTVTQSTHTHGQTQAQLVSSSGTASSLSVSSMPFASHAQPVGTAGGGSTATFTVLPSTTGAGGRAIGHQQLIIPASAGHAVGAAPQHMVIPLHTSVKVTTGAAPTTTGGGATVSALPMPVPVAANTLVSSFMRKRDAEGSPIRGVKNLAPTLLSMSSNTNSSANVATVNLPSGSAFNLQPVSVAPASTQQQLSTSVVSCSALTVEALAKKERERVSSAAAAVGASSASTASASTTAGSIVSTRNVRADSPASSDGSTTVSANSSPGVDQQLQDSNLSINRIGNDDTMPGAVANRENTTHFNPINEVGNFTMSITHTMFNLISLFLICSYIQHISQR